MDPKENEKKGEIIRHVGKANKLEHCDSDAVFFINILCHSFLLHDDF